MRIVCYFCPKGKQHKGCIIGEKKVYCGNNIECKTACSVGICGKEDHYVFYEVCEECENLLSVLIFSEWRK